MKFDTKASSNMRFAFSALDRKHPFWANWSKKVKLLVKVKICYLEKYAEFNGNVHFLFYGLEILFSANSVQKINIVCLRILTEKKARSNKTPALTKSMDMDIWVVGPSNQPFIRRGS